MNDVFQFLTMRCFNDVSENCQTSCKRCILTMFLWRFLFHAETKKYKCTQCKKHFSPNINLKSHSLVHTGVKPQRCTNCNYSANQGASLKKHINATKFTTWQRPLPAKNYPFSQQNCTILKPQTSPKTSHFLLNDAMFWTMYFNFWLCDFLTMFQKIAKHRANDASLTMHRPPLDPGGTSGRRGD